MKELEVIINNIDGVNVVSSRDVANSFNKRHGDVIRSIEDKMEVNAILRSPNYFIESTYKDNSNRTQKEYGTDLSSEIMYTLLELTHQISALGQSRTKKEKKILEKLVIIRKDKEYNVLKIKK